MTITKIKPTGWALGEKLTSADMSAVDANVEKALDKTAGATDTLGSAVVASLAGRITPSVKTAADADTTYAMGDGISVLRVPATITADRIYTLSTTGANDGDIVTAYLEPSAGGKATIKTGATTLYVLGGGEGKVASFIYRASATAWKRLFGRGPTLATIIFTAAYTAWVCPEGVSSVIVQAWGGGGGGGGGMAGTTATSTSYTGGGGGGGAMRHFGVFVATPGETYTAIVGAGGAGGAAGISGSPGGNTAVWWGLTNLLNYYGGEGGRGATRPSTVARNVYARGGAPHSGAQFWTPPSSPDSGASLQYIENVASVPLWTDNSISLPMAPGQGGWSLAAGSLSADGNGTVGAAGTSGTMSGTSWGGGGGGGGGAGPGWASTAGAGANGGVGNNAGAGAAGANGSAGSANGGGGGGGGGAGGCGSASGGAGGTGGAGGSGTMTFTYIIPGD